MSKKDSLKPVDVNNPEQTRQTANLLPAYLRTDKNSKFLGSTLDQLVQPAELKRVDGYIGSKLSPNYNPLTDNYLNSGSDLKSKYQLQPSQVVRDSNGKITSTTTFDDLVNKVSFHSGVTNNLDRLFKSKVYSYNPLINWDKFVNFREYYWLPTGPDSVEITGLKKDTVSTLSVKELNGSLIFTPDGINTNPLLTLYKGMTYVFNIETSKPFYIKTTYTNDTSNLYANVKNNGVTNGQIILTVDDQTPKQLFYILLGEETAVGRFNIVSIDNNVLLDVEKEILGKKTYTSGNQVEFTNGLKVRFIGNISPSIYANNEFYVEGVGDYIQLVPVNELQPVGKQTTNLDTNFDATLFDEYPFDDFGYVPLSPEYVTINRASQDRNQWSRYNRWFHYSVIENAAKYNNVTPVYPTGSRAQRPIIEFQAGLQLHNFGNKFKYNVNTVDTVTTDVFKNIENSTGYAIDGVALQAGQKILFLADNDPLVYGKVFEVKINLADGKFRINLEELTDSSPNEGDCVYVTEGTNYVGTTWWYNGTIWKSGQNRELLNQFPLFGLVDESGYEYSDSTYFSSSFAGTKIFGYQEGAFLDPVLNFNVDYRSVSNTGEFLFSNNFMTDTFTIFNGNNSTEFNVSSGFLKVNKPLGVVELKTVWEETDVVNIPIIQTDVFVEDVKYYEVTSLENPGFLSDLKTEVFLNNKKLVLGDDYYLVPNNEKLYVLSTTTFSVNDKIILKLYTSASPINSGFYETPLNLTNNPLNSFNGEYSFTEIENHVESLVNTSENFAGTFPGVSNLRDLPITSFGTRILMHSDPISYASYFLGKETETDIVSSIRSACNDYNTFKMNLIRLSGSVSDNYSAPDALDYILTQLNSFKDETFPYNYSDMVPYGSDYSTRKYFVVNVNNKVYSLESTFDDETLSNRSVLIYLNDVLLVKDRDYKFNKYEPSFTILTTLNRNDVISIKDYSNTTGCFIPETPTKLGLYPKYVPSILSDDTYINEPVQVIQGHDGSLLAAFGDFRDEIILEFEKRVYNNIKSTYNAELFNPVLTTPGAFRKSDFESSDVVQMYSSEFMQWVGFYGVDYQENTVFDEANTFTFNHTGLVDCFNKSPLAGYWRNVYKYYFDTDRPHTHPWEMIGLTVQPEWWENTYGPAPYTSGNTILWEDMENGYNAFSNTYNELYKRPGLSKILPVDETGNLLSPTQSGLATTPIVNINDTARVVVLRSSTIAATWKIGDCSPVETSWMRSSYWPFAKQIVSVLSRPAEYCAKMFDISKMKKNSAGNWLYNNKFNDIRNIQVPAIDNLCSGYSVWLSELGSQKTKNYTSILKSEVSNVEFNLVAKLGGFTSKEKLQVSIDAVDVASPYQGTLLPSEDYTIYFNKSNPILSIGVSGIIVQKTNRGWSLRGYDKYNPYFKILQPRDVSGQTILKVGGTSETYVKWQTNTTYDAGQIVFYTDRYYEVLVKHNSDLAFNLNYYQQLPYLPIVGGASVFNRTSFETSTTTVMYGSEFTTLQDVFDVIVGYGAYLESLGFVFDEYNSDLESVLDWTFAGKEFLYWTTQNWAENAVITLSPFANKLTFRSNNGVVDNLINTYYDFSVLRANGNSFEKTNLTISRVDGTFEIVTVNTNEGIYFAQLNVVQKEHAIVLNNKTLFNDIVYDLETGFRQERLKIKGFITDNWNGDIFSPGFVFDEAYILDWKIYTDYTIGDIVQYSGNYYSCLKSTIGSDTFDYASWYKLPEKPISQLLPNFDYKINQFEDFYSLDIDNFDANQQSMAQHLIGYTPRPYLNFIISDPIAQYKFYQGFIREKGTINPISKLSKASQETHNASIEILEEWAFRVGEYGGFNTFQELQFGLESSGFTGNPQIVKFVTDKPSTSEENVYYRTVSDIELKPVGYDPSSIFTSSYDTSVFKLPVAGYARFDDVKATAFNTNSLLDIASNSGLSVGDKIWVGFDNKNDWDILRVSSTPTYITNVELISPGAGLLFTTYYEHQLTVGQIVNVYGIAAGIDKCYIVRTVESANTFTVDSTLQLTPVLPDVIKGSLLLFKSCRYSSFDKLADVSFIDTWKTNENVWVDSDINGKWTVYKKIENYDSNHINSLIVVVENQNFGSSIYANEHTTVFVVGSPNYALQSDVTTDINTPKFISGQVYIMHKNSISEIECTETFGLNDNTVPWVNTGTNSTMYGNKVWYDNTNNFVVASAYKASNVNETNTSTHIVNTSVQNFNSNENQGVVKITQLSDTFTLGSNAIVLSSGVPQSNYGWDFVLSLPDQYSSTISINTASIQLGDAVTGEYIKGVPFVNKIGNNFIELTISQTVNTATSFSFSVSKTGYTEVDNTTTLIVSNTASILPNSVVYSPYLNSNVTVQSVGDNVVYLNSPQTINTSSVITFTNVQASGYTIGTKQKLLVSAPSVDGKETGNVYVYNVSTSTGVSVELDKTISQYNTQTNQLFGYSISSNSNGSKYAISSPGNSEGNNYGKIYVYDERISASYIQEITTANIPHAFGINDIFASKIKMTHDGEYLIVSSPYATDNLTNAKTGVVDIFKWDETLFKFAFNQRISSPISSLTADTVFGFDLSISENNEVLTISSIGTSKAIKPTFDKYSETLTGYVNDPSSIEKKNQTVFDGRTTLFSNKIENAGTVHVYNKVGEGSTKWVHAEVLSDSSVNPNSNYGSAVIANNDSIFVGAPATANLPYNNGIGQVYIFDKLDTSTNSWSVLRQQEPIVDSSNIQRAITVDNITGQIQTYFDVIDAAKGLIPGLAKAELSYISPYDPAIYSIGTDGVNINAEANWLDENVGKLWWDLSTVKYVWYEQGDLSYRKNNWNAVFPGSTFDVYEWVKSDLTPAQWLNAVSSGSPGYSGQPKFTDNSVMSIKQVPNSLNTTMQNVYYFWVKNRVTVPVAKNRSMTAYDVANLLANPLKQGLEYVSVLSTDSIMLSNAQSLLPSEQISFNLSFNTDLNSAKRHTEWKMVSENSAYANIPKSILQKFVDSLLGHDVAGNDVPDSTLSPKEKYGVSIRPRQSMFINRRAAVRNIVEYSNGILKDLQLTNRVSFSNLNKFEELPSTSEVDIVLNDYYSLEQIITAGFVTAIVEPNIDSNGSIVGVNIINAGNGYINPPTLQINGLGTEFSATTEIDILGKITKVNILNVGKNYNAVDTDIVVRPYTALVKVDENSSNKWAVYQWNSKTLMWDKVRTQSYDTTQYWDYVDWHSADYEFNKPLLTTVASPYVLYTLLGVSSVGDYVKVQNSGDGRYAVLSRTDGTKGTFDSNWDIVYSERGTIQLSNDIWNTTNRYAWDYIAGYDDTEYDQMPDKELEFILKALMEDIFVSDKQVYQNQMFFKGIKYALTEQKNPDWVFKTTFVEVINNSGNLSQPATYEMRNAHYYEDFINEIKPYHTKIRNYTEVYTTTEFSSTFNTDFDMPVYFNTNTKTFDKVTFGNSLLLQYPWKSWFDNYAYQIDSVDIYDGGEGYSVVPSVEIITAKGDTGFGATAVAYITNGSVSQILITNPGQCYTTAPTIVLVGGGNKITREARLYPQLGNNPVRHNTVRIKFDRVSTSRELGSQYVTETIGPVNGNDVSFVLKWAPQPNKENIILLKNGILQLVDSYDITFKTEKFAPQGTTSYSKIYGYLVLNYKPNFGDTFEITYPKSLNYYNAVSRIEDYYNPTSGMLGKDINQLMLGTEYAGLTVTGTPLDDASGWDASGTDWEEKSWDISGKEYGYTTFLTTETSTQTFVIPELITTGTQLNVYVKDASKFGNSKRIDGTGTNSIIKTVEGLGTGAIDRIDMIVPGFGYKDGFTIVSVSSPETETGRSAIVTATVHNGSVGIDIIDQGSGYLTAPIVTITEVLSNLNSTSTVTAKAYARAYLKAEFKEYNSTATKTDIVIPASEFTNTSTLVTIRYSTSDGTANAYDPDSLDAIIDAGDMSMTTALGLNPNDIILDGGSQQTRSITKMNDDGFLNAYNSYAPEECVPGQVHESLSVSVFERPEMQSATIANVFYEVDNSRLTYDLALNPINTDAIIATFNNIVLEKTEYAIDYVNNTFTFNSVTPGTGILSLTSMQLGAIKLLQTISENINSETSFYSFNSYTEVGSVYVTVNGVPVNPTVIEYNGVAKITVSEIGFVQLYILSGKVNSYSEIKKSVYTTSLGQTEIELSTVPGISGPLHNEVIVTKNKVRLTPPVSTYWEVQNGATIFDISESIKFVYGTIDTKSIEVYVNGDQIQSKRKWTYNQTQNTIKFYSGVLSDGDLVAIIVKCNNEYEVTNGKLILSTPANQGDIIEVTTFTNHDPEFIRSDVFDAISSNRYTLQRQVLDTSYVWVTYNGVNLKQNVDFTIDTDNRTVVLREELYTGSNAKVVITSFGLHNYSVGYRMFVDMLGRTTFKRISKPNTTVLTSELKLTDTVIHVKDSSVLSQPRPNSNVPGVVFINGERIEFFTVSGNVLGQLRRSTLGTGAKSVYSVGTNVVDQGSLQTIKSTEKTMSVTTATTTSTQYDYDISALNLSNLVDYNNQVIVKYQGIGLLKPGTHVVVHDYENSYDTTSTDANRVPDFFVNNNTLTLNSESIQPIKGSKLEVKVNTSFNWLERNTSIMSGNTEQTRFIASVETVYPK